MTKHEAGVITQEYYDWLQWAREPDVQNVIDDLIDKGILKVKPPLPKGGNPNE